MKPDSRQDTLPELAEFMVSTADLLCVIYGERGARAMVRRVTVELDDQEMVVGGGLHRVDGQLRLDFVLPAVPALDLPGDEMSDSIADRLF